MGGQIIDLGIPECREWIFNKICKVIDTSGATGYRQDFNSDPAPAWAAKDAKYEGRTGMSENQYVQGYLALWDALIEKYGMFIDSCASGGGRNDLETMKRGVPLHYSDHFDGGNEDYNARVKEVIKQARGNRAESAANTQRDNQRVYLVHQRDKIIPLSIDDVAFFYTSNEKVSAVTYDGTYYLIDRTLESLQSALPEIEFFRANRQFIIARKAVKDITVWFGSRLSLNLTVALPEKIIISKARVPEFKQWLMTTGV